MDFDNKALGRIWKVGHAMLQSQPFWGRDQLDTTHSLLGRVKLQVGLWGLAHVKSSMAQLNSTKFVNRLNLSTYLVEYVESC